MALIIEFRLLAGIEVMADGRRVGTGYPKEQLVLACLLLAEGGRVTVSDLIEKVWGEPSPETARDLIHGYINKLRQHLPDGGKLIPPHDGGYLIQVDRARVDVHRFHDLLSEAYAALGMDDLRAAQRFRQALAQWGHLTYAAPEGDPLPGLPGRWADNHRHLLREEHRAARIECITTELRLGEHNKIIPELSLAARTGLPDERLGALLMLTYHKAGRRQDALNFYAEFRTRMSTELGIDPSPDLVSLQQQILANDHPPSLPGMMMHAQQPDIDALSGRVVSQVMKDKDPVLRERLEIYFRDNPAGMGALTLVREEPANPEAAPALQRILTRALSEDPGFAREIEQLLAVDPVGNSFEVRAQQIGKQTIFQHTVKIDGDFNIS